MEQQILKKISRYLELSKQFSKSSNDIFEGRGDNLSYTVRGTIHNLSGSSGDIYVHMGTESEKLPTRAEIIRQESEVWELKANEYDEYLNLQKELNNYINAYTKITE